MTAGISPLSLILICWGLTGAVAITGLANLTQLDLVTTFMRREGISAEAFRGAGLAWIIIGLLAFAVGDLAARITRATPPARRPARTDVNRAARLTFRANLVLLGVTGLWIVTAAGQAGGLLPLAAAVFVDNLTTRDLLLESKLFTGMRLFYAALPATGGLAAGLLASRSLTKAARRAMLFTLVVNTVALCVLPIVMSQRLLLLQLLFSAYLTACLVRREVFGLLWMAVAAALFLGLWTAREAVTNPTIDGTALQVAWQKLAFYVINDMFNAFAPLNRPIPHTYGGLTLEGVMFLTLTDSYFLAQLAPKMAELDTVIGGGEFPFFTAAYVDFGMVGGVALIVAV
ncbi:MAG: hypothetical protein AAFN94_09125, partial [Pseudomonadota bacterium]